MGISLDSMRFLVETWKSGRQFDTTLTLGRQDVAVSPDRIERLLRKHGAWPQGHRAERIRALLAANDSRFEGIARALGARTVDACDNSAYEGATLVHDLNEPIPREWEQRYTMVIDGGTLEHVFHFPNAITNCMRWTQVGGHLILLTPANNFFGHGFYQFSPELFYRVLSPANGFEVEQMICVEDSIAYSTLFGIRYPFPISGSWYAVNDPAVVGARVTLISRRPVMLYVLAKRFAEVSPLREPPQQSGYLAAWRQGEGFHAARHRPAAKRPLAWISSRLPEHVWREWLPQLLLLVDPLRQRRFFRRNSFQNRRFYRPVR